MYKCKIASNVPDHSSIFLYRSNQFNQRVIPCQRYTIKVTSDHIQPQDKRKLPTNQPTNQAQTTTIRRNLQTQLRINQARRKRLLPSRQKEKSLPPPCCSAKISRQKPPTAPLSLLSLRGKQNISSSLPAPISLPNINNLKHPLQPAKQNRFQHPPIKSRLQEFKSPVFLKRCRAECEDGDSFVGFGGAWVGGVAG